MLREFGIFNEDGLVEGRFYSRQDAVDALSERVNDGSLEVMEICPEHEGQPKHGCEFCEDYIDEEFFDGEDEEF